ncbi:uncharacterized protein K452DRAFT_251918 [Aplosporella prunicola CBS 121167]|uniref:Helix-turn-helix domain-containing protein n=1 Tax=Aplosporella prunicola CBS 121167 TaxID=1176127 RepID=A0A6A6BCE3_9PEZI|nr:uncharacterized protein K452DRAFT_251918 [Aplosporella prunicola CBS 121167]KAF2141023.1 hypothetical protein K452DRAFT_251918 [Aplosporella prunicola CBS 121167]
MGSSASKASRAANIATRVYPARASQAATNAVKPAPAAGRAAQPGPTVQPQPKASETRDEAINLDAADPAFAAHLRSIGPVQPNPHYSPSSTSPFDPQRPPGSSSTSQPTATGRRPADSSIPDFSTGPNPFAPPIGAMPNPATNPALAILAARERLQAEAENEFANVGRRGAPGRQFLDVGIVKQMFILRDQRGKSEEEIEKLLGLEKGMVKKLGTKGVSEAV